MSPSGTLKKCQKYLLPYRSKFDRRSQWKHTNCKNVHVSRNRKMLVKMYFTRFEAGFLKVLKFHVFLKKLKLCQRFLSVGFFLFCRKNFKVKNFDY